MEETEHKRDDLQPCIFCGFKSAVLIVEQIGGMPEADDNYYVRCRNCYAQGPAWTDEQKAIAAWNRAFTLLWHYCAQVGRWAGISDV